MLATRTTIATIALILLSILHVNRNKFLAHPSLKILLLFHFLWIYLTNAHIIVDHLYSAYLLLTMGYQISENIRMIRIMLPVVWSHALITCITIVLYLIVLGNGISQWKLPLFEDSINSTFLQGIFMPI
ncbi:hypothetical protein PFISCL1PPCAC_13447, partial [Pristionchus fissidentatus]